LDSILRGSAAYNDARSAPGRSDPGGRSVPAGLKLRCAAIGQAPAPTAPEIARALAAAREARLALKCTAGLHHPLARPAEGAHGFLNVFGAALLAYACNLSADALLPVLEDSEASHFRFGADGFAWQSLTVATERIAELRKTFVTSFGSCSFDEPREDLRALGLLP